MATPAEAVQFNETFCLLCGKPGDRPAHVAWLFGVARATLDKARRDLSGS
jgi:hypothetical protein